MKLSYRNSMKNFCLLSAITVHILHTYDKKDNSDFLDMRVVCSVCVLKHSCLHLTKGYLSAANDNTAPHIQKDLWDMYRCVVCWLWYIRVGIYELYCASDILLIWYSQLLRVKPAISKYALSFILAIY